MTDERFELVERLMAFAEQHGHTILELAMSWLASQPEIATVIAGATSAEQVRANAEAVEAWRLSEDEFAEVDDLLGDDGPQIDEQVSCKLVVTRTHARRRDAGPRVPTRIAAAGSKHGGWAPPYFDQVMADVAAEGIAKGGALLFGRRTFEQFASFWSTQTDDNPFAAVLNDRQKYVASTTLRAARETPRCSEVDAMEAVATLKEQPDGDTRGARRGGELVASLMRPTSSTSTCS